jgi:hypothetical protein
MPVPNQSAANGTQAIGAMKRTASKAGATMRSTQRNHAISRPSGMPITTASTNPNAKRWKLDSRWRNSVKPANGSTTSWAKRAATSHGAGRNSREVSPASAAALQNRKKLAAPAADRAQKRAGRGAARASAHPPRHRALLDPARPSVISQPLSATLIMPTTIIAG